MTDLPEARLTVQDIENAVPEILAFAAGMVARGERPWFEVWYPPPLHLHPADVEEWPAAQAETFDAVEVIDGEIVNLPPYEELGVTR